MVVPPAWALSPLRASVPAPLLVRAPLPLVSLDNENVVPAVETSILPPPDCTLIWFDATSVAVMRSVPPLRLTLLVALPSLSAAVLTSPPELMLSVPVPLLPTDNAPEMVQEELPVPPPTLTVPLVPLAS